jgi:DNA replication protein DnaC
MSDPQVPDFASIVALAKVPGPCRMCGAPLDFPGICDPCAGRLKDQMRREQVTAALQSIPATHSWADLENPELLMSRARSVSLPVLLSSAKSIMDGAAKKGKNESIVTGPTGAGKTSCACAMMRYAIVHSDLGPGARFVSAARLVRDCRETPRGQVPPAVHECDLASILVLDDLGQDAMYRDYVRVILEDRISRRRRTIVTTFLSEDEVSSTYGSGVKRRLFDGLHIRLGAAPTRRIL